MAGSPLWAKLRLQLDAYAIQGDLELIRGTAAALAAYHRQGSSRLRGRRVGFKPLDGFVAYHRYDTPSPVRAQMQLAQGGLTLLFNKWDHACAKGLLHRLLQQHCSLTG